MTMHAMQTPRQALLVCTTHTCTQARPHTILRNRIRCDRRCCDRRCWPAEVTLQRATLEGPLRRRLKESPRRCGCFRRHQSTLVGLELLQQRLLGEHMCTMTWHITLPYTTGVCMWVQHMTVVMHTAGRLSGRIQSSGRTVVSTHYGRASQSMNPRQYGPMPIKQTVHGKPRRYDSVSLHFVRICVARTHLFMHICSRMCVRKLAAAVRLSALSLSL
jgi:hypothetical protein